MNKFKIVSDKKPKGDQPKAIKEIISNFKKGNKRQVLLGATGTGKTYTIANIIEKLNKKTLVIAHNKTLAAQLYRELKGLFPNNRVEYFISTFDYYQPEAYMPKSDTYIEKSSMTNKFIEMQQMASINSLLHRDDTIVVSSVAAIYGLRDPEEYLKSHLEIALNDTLDRTKFALTLVDMGYKRTNGHVQPGEFRLRGDVIQICFPWSDEILIQIDLFGDQIDEILEIHSLNGDVVKRYDRLTISPADPYSVEKALRNKIIGEIEHDLEKRLKYFEEKGLLLEKQRLEQRVRFDLEQLKEIGFVSGIENYSLYLDRRKVGEPPFTLFDYFGDDFLLVMDESHMSVPQIGGMYLGDRSRKQTLVDYGFRLPTALDNRPLKFDELEKKLSNVIYLSATPGKYELEKKYPIVEQIIRPTGLLDPILEVRKTTNQMDDIIEEIHKRKKLNERVIITTVTKKLAEDIASYITEKGINTAYIHDQLTTLERDDVITKFRMGLYDALVGINLLREGIDIPEVSLIAILDADKSGFMRNTRSLIQIIGRASRNSNGKVIMYGDEITSAMQEAIDETNRRRTIQEEFNKKYNITPKTIIKPISNLVLSTGEEFKLNKKLSAKKITKLQEEMEKAAKNLDFEKAIELRDILSMYKKK